VTDMESELVGLLMGFEVREVLSELVNHDAKSQLIVQSRILCSIPDITIRLSMRIVQKWMAYES